MDYENIMKPDGAYEGLKQAQKEGKIRFIGITSHSCPVSMYAVRSGLFDTHLIAYNIVGREFERCIQLAAKNISGGKGNIAGSITKEGDTYLLVHISEDTEMILLEWSIAVNKVAWG